ncbi:MAG: 5-amino-6-(D-ribitylamino)uracil--L-tyrosine 4-hydroxyphenyl transferase CofH [Verrucomicrobiota bacterium]
MQKPAPAFSALRPLVGPLTYSPSVTVALTHACAWRCRYCGYRESGAGLIRNDEIDRLLELAQADRATEVLVIAGEQPDRLPRVRRDLRERGHEGFLDFAHHVCERILDAGLLPHSNLGALSEEEFRRLRPVNASMGLMLENADDGFNRAVAPQKTAAGRIAAIAAAGRARVPFTSGILIGLGESQASRFASLEVLARLHGRYGHLQEIIIQNYLPNAGSDWPAAEPPSFDEYLELIAHWRGLAPDVAVQVPPNLNPHWARLLPYLDDLGGISSEPDVVNPERRWAKRRRYAHAALAGGRELRPRLPVYPRYFHPDWIEGRAREVAQVHSQVPERVTLADAAATTSRDIWEWPLERLREEAAALNARLHGDRVTYVVNRNANFTNVCNVGCHFCGFQRRAGDADAYRRAPEEVVARLAATPHITEVCLQGGIDPAYKFEDYTALIRAIKRWQPEVHVHAFSPMEIHSLHRKTGWPYEEVLAGLQAAGVDSIPGTAAEILDDEVRARISSLKLRAGEWLEIVGTAHRLGLSSTATVMYGHVETWAHLRVHFERLRRLQNATGGFTEFIPLAFIPHQNRLGRSITPDPAVVAARTDRLYPLARLFFGEAIPHLQTSWVKLGPEAAAAQLGFGCDDFGGTLYEESITQASGGPHGGGLTPKAIEAAIRAAGKVPHQRRTIY